MSNAHYAGLDVSQEITSICVVDEAGCVVWRGKCASDPDNLAAVLRRHAPALMRAGLETGSLSNYLTRTLRDRGIPAVCLDARHAKAALKLQINKTDANDAHGLAQVTRTGWYGEVAIKSMDAQTLRLLLVTRAQLVSQRQAIANTLLACSRPRPCRLPGRWRSVCQPSARGQPGQCSFGNDRRADARRVAKPARADRGP